MLDEETEEALASRADEQSWAASFEATTADQWDRLAALAKQEDTAGETISLEEAFPSYKGGL
jgi:hypothetical protein